MKYVMITGATGFIGQKLSESLLKKGYKLKIVSRQKKPNFPYPHKLLLWDDIENKEAFESVEAVFHLAGEAIASKKWTTTQKKEILNSRSQLTTKLVKALNHHRTDVKAFISAGAIGFYGEGEKEQTEDSAKGNGFLSKVCEEWENPLLELKALRVVVLRLGLVLDRNKGFLKELEPLFRKGIAGPLASGRQWMSWIHIKDVVRLFLYVLDNENLYGAFNATTNSPIRNKDFTKIFYETLKLKPLFKLNLPAPKIALKIMLGQRANLVLASQKVIPHRFSKETNFKFQFPQLQTAFKDLYLHKGASLLERNLWVFQPLQKVFKFFSNPYNLKKITPPSLQLQIIHISTEQIKKHTHIHYKFKISKFPLSWITEITDWNPPHYFTDSQKKGPYNHWMHDHFFEEVQRGTLIKDRIFYTLPLRFLDLGVTDYFIRKNLEKIFSYRSQKTKEILEDQKIKLN